MIPRRDCGPRPCGRRAFLGGLAGSVSLAAMGNLGGCSPPGPCADDEATFRRGDAPDRQGVATELISAAILAASPHNTQPWRFRLDGAAIELFGDDSRTLGAFDPMHREMHIGLGCALENLVIAAAARPLATEVRVEPDPAPPDRIARIILTPSMTPPPPEANALAAAIPVRHTNRGPYHRDRPIDDAIVERLKGTADDRRVRVILLDADSPEGVAFARQTVEATSTIIADQEMMAASDTWFRDGCAEICKFRDGVTVTNAGLSPLMEGLAWILPRPSATIAHRIWLSATRETHCATAPMFGLIAVRGRDQQTLLQAGRLWQRVHLLATALGIAMQPLNQAMEWADRQRALGRDEDFSRTLAELAGDRDLAPVFGFRLGYAERPARPSLRRPVQAVLMG